MFPKLFDLGPISVYTYGLLLALSYLLALQVAVSRGVQRGITAARLMDLGIFIILSAVLGAKLLLVLVDFDYFVRNPRDLFSLFRSGGVFYGGLILAVAVGVVVCAPASTCRCGRSRMRPRRVSPSGTSSVGSGAFWGGAATAARRPCRGRSPSRARTRRPMSGRHWACRFTPRNSTRRGRNSSSCSACLAFERRGRSFPGRTFFAYLLVYAVSRFGIEFYRGDPRGFVFDHVSTSQFISLLLVPVSLGMLWWLSRRPAPDVVVSAKSKDLTPRSRRAGR